MNLEQVRRDFDEIARLAEDGASGADRYDGLLLDWTRARPRTFWTSAAGSAASPERWPREDIGSSRSIVRRR